ncbi:MATE family efflux transporter [Spiroplasma clarkii]|nr:MATE family efflux transporter [Spiroplasma clarkii]
MENKNNLDNPKSNLDYKLSKAHFAPFQKIQTPWYKANDVKEILNMGLPIFAQLLFNILIAIINLIAVNNFDGGHYKAPVAKAVVMYNTLQFIPSLISTGTIIVCGNLLGQGKKEELSKVILTGLLINASITGLIFALTEGFSEGLARFLESSDDVATDNSWTDTAKFNFLVKYYRLLNINLILLSFTQVFVAGLQSIKKSKHVMIGTIITDAINLVLVYTILYSRLINPVYSALTIPIAGIFQMCYMLFMCLRFIDFKINKKQQLNKIYAIETLKTGLPITIEMGVWNICNFFTSSAIGSLHDDSLFVLHRNATNIGQISSAFVQALGTVTSVFVARKVGEQDTQGAYETALNCWKVAIYGTVIVNIMMVALSWPILVLFGSRDVAWPIEVILLLIFAVKLLFDTVNMTLLRALWAVGDLWFPIIISFFTMGIGMVALPFLVVKGFNIIGGWGLILIYLVLVSDPLSHSIVYTIMWICTSTFFRTKN